MSSRAYLNGAGLTNQLHSYEEIASRSKAKVNINKCFSFRCCGESNMGKIKDTTKSTCPDCNGELFTFLVTEHTRDDLFNRARK